MTKVLIIIPARVGSKRIKNKNIRKVKNKPLLHWTIRYAKKYYKNEDIIISSNSKVVKTISKNEKIPFDQRPNYLSSDKSNIYFTIVHVLKKIKGFNIYKYVALLQPTSPIRPKNLIKKSIDILEKNKKFQNLIHLEKTNYNIGSIVNNEWVPINDGKIRSQDIVNQYRPSGCLFLYKIKNIQNYKSFLKRKVFGFLEKENMDTVNIDDEYDFKKLDYLLKNNPKVL